MTRRSKRNGGEDEQLFPIGRGKASKARRRRNNLRFERTMFNLFASTQFSRSSLDEITDELFRRMDFWGHLGISRQQALRFFAREYVRHWMRDYRDERGHRVYQHTGDEWIHLPGRNWLATRESNAPDGRLTRKEHEQDLSNMAHEQGKRARGNKAAQKATIATIKAIREGAVFSQPQLLDDEQSA